VVLVRRAAEVHDFREFFARVELNGDIELISRLLQLTMPPRIAAVRRFIAAERQTRGSPVNEIVVLEAPPWETVLAGLRACRPMLVRQALTGWAALEWGPDGFQARFGEVRHRFMLAEEALSAFLGRGRAPGGDVHQTYSKGTALPPELAACFPTPFPDQRHLFGAAQLWLGSGPPGQAITPLHRDTEHGFLGHVFGVKTLLFHSPDQADCLYPYEGFGGSQMCRVKPAAPALALFPRFAQARPLEVTLTAGDLLVIPRGWFHEAYAARNPVLSVSFFLKDDDI
jgi:hypothetical protein